MLHTLAAKVVVGIIASLGTLRLGTGLYFWRVTEALERPSYTVIAKLSDGVEIRQYEPYLIAETTVDGVGFREPTRDGFRACASYIFGNNTKAAQRTAMSRWLSSAMTSTSTSSSGTPEEKISEKMQMTAPVRVTGEAPPSVKRNKNSGSAAATEATRKSNAKKTKVSFVIGSKYSLQTAPKPVDPKVKIRRVPSHTLAVKTFSGPPPNDDRVQKERTKIEKALEAARRKVPGSEAETLVYGYHDPFITPSFLRRNEVALVVEGNV